MLTKITAAQVEVLKKSFSKKNLEAVLLGVELLNASIEAKGWLPHSSRKVRAAFSKEANRYSTISTMYHKARKLEREFYTKHWDAIRSIYNKDKKQTAEEKAIRAEYEVLTDKAEGLDDLRSFINYRQQHKHFVSGLAYARTIIKDGSLDYIEELIPVMQDIQSKIEFLDDLIPAPVFTAVGLSPKVTATLKETNLDIDLKSIRFPEIILVTVPRLDSKGNPMFYEDGKPMMTWEQRILWPENIKHNASRFANSGCRCEACGKPIPSGMFVPVEADDMNDGRPVSLWVGTDCAKNIFGIKHQGFDLTALDKKK